MYVRWKKQKRSKKEHGVYFDKSYPHPRPKEVEAYLLTAYLVENTRIDGKPRQKILAYLGSIIDVKIANMGARNRFWENVKTHLKEVKLDRDQKAAIVQKIAQRIPKVSDDEWNKIQHTMALHPSSRGKRERDQLKAFREQYNLPGDDIR